MVEPLVQRICATAGFEVAYPFPRLTYQQAMFSYGSTSRTCDCLPFMPSRISFPEPI